jgi:hypothetical protein
MDNGICTSVQFKRSGAVTAQSVASARQSAAVVQCLQTTRYLPPLARISKVLKFIKVNRIGNSLAECRSPVGGSPPG